MAKHSTTLETLFDIYMYQYLRAYNDLNPWMYSRKQKNNKGMFKKTYRKLVELERSKNRFWPR